MTMEPKGFVIQPGQGPVWDRSEGRSVALKLLSGETAESVMMFEGTALPGYHLHHNSDEITFKIGDQITVGGPGTCAFMPRGIPHAWKSTGAGAGRILFSYTPAEAGKWFEELRLSERSIDDMDDSERAEIHRRHGWERI